MDTPPTKSTWFIREGNPQRFGGIDGVWYRTFYVPWYLRWMMPIARWRTRRKVFAG